MAHIKVKVVVSEEYLYRMSECGGEVHHTESHFISPPIIGGIIIIITIIIITYIAVVRMQLLCIDIIRRNAKLFTGNMCHFDDVCTVCALSKMKASFA